MEETVTTTVETPEVQTTPETSENQTIENEQTLDQVQGDEITQPDDVQESGNVEEETTETETVQEPPKDWEKIAKDNQASFTKVSQELAELKKQIAENKPKMVQEGKINPEFEQQYRFEVDNREYLAYDNLARQLEPEQRAVVENLLREAQRLYNPKNTNAYEQKMSQVKDYFRSDLVESIAKEKLELLSQVKEKFDSELLADKQERARQATQAIENVPEVNELVNPDSENYSQEVFEIVKAMFDYTGKIDVESTSKAIKAIKDLAVKEYIAKQKAEAEKAKAIVPTGTNVVETKTPTITAEMASKNYQKYIDDFMKKGLSFNDAMNKVDEIIMKGQ